MYCGDMTVGKNVGDLGARGREKEERREEERGKERRIPLGRFHFQCVVLNRT
jgi:hypothetical protein